MTGGAVAPSVRITFAGPPTGPGGGPLIVFRALAFDQLGNLWAIANDAIVELTPDQLALGGAIVPAVVISPNGSNFTDPGALAFDRDGNLWVTAGTSTIVKFLRDQLDVSGSPVPQGSISLSLPATGIAFRSDGALWATDANVARFDIHNPPPPAPGMLFEITPAQLETGGSITPAVTLTGNSGGSIEGPVGIAFQP